MRCAGGPKDRPRRAVVCPLPFGQAGSGPCDRSPSSKTTLPITLESFNLGAAERQLGSLALDTAGDIVEAAKLLGVTRHALKRRIVKHKITWTRRSTSE